MRSNRFCLLSEMWSAAVQTTPERGFFLKSDPEASTGALAVSPAGRSHRFGREDGSNAWSPQAAAPGGLLMEGLVPSQMKLDTISTNCLLKTVRTVLHQDRKSFNCSNNIDSDDF